MPGTGNGKNGGGRPTERDEAKRSAVAVRTTPAIKSRLSAAAAAAGRSLTQEIEARLIRSFEDEDRAGGPHNAALLRMIGSVIEIAEQRSAARWTEDVRAWSAVKAALALVVEANQPEIPAAIARAYRLAEAEPSEHADNAERLLHVAKAGPRWDAFNDAFEPIGVAADQGKDDARAILSVLRGGGRIDGTQL